MSAVDAFADLDHMAHREGRAFSVSRDCGLAYSADQVARTARSIDAHAVAYTSDFENHPAAVARLARGLLLGNPPEVLRRVRNPFVVARTLTARGFAVPQLWSGAEDGEPGDQVLNGESRIHHSRPDPSHPPRLTTHCLAKPLASGGGHSIVPWRAGQALAAGMVLQERIAGIPGSIVFAADGERAVPFALTRQLIGDRAFGAHGFKYCGNILVAAGDPYVDRGRGLLERAMAVARVVVEAFGLVGVNGIDFIARQGVPYPIEINPRYTAAMELAERAYGLSVFEAHAAGCAAAVPAFDLEREWRSGGAVGKAVIYARHTIVLGDTRRWCDDDTMRDVPHPGERIARGRPVCTVFARGRDGSACYAALVRRAGQVYEQLDRWRRTETRMRKRAEHAAGNTTGTRRRVATGHEDTE
ncbi:MAG TPA: ATP-grasp domain-containing protein [Gemmatimonadaceae bacterium]|nr:ATP-grasp domain-containing protein [Gemmatimonadaceae bacterium]